MNEYLSIAGLSVVTASERQKITLPDIMLDPIEMSHFTRPVFIRESSHIYEHKTILRWLEKSDTDPITRKKITYESMELIPVLHIYAAALCIQCENEEYYFWPPRISLLSLLTCCSDFFMENNITLLFRDDCDKLALEQILYCCPFSGLSLGNKYKISSKGFPVHIDYEINDATEICFLSDHGDIEPPPFSSEIEVDPYKFVIMTPSIDLINKICEYIKTSEINLNYVRKINEIIKKNEYKLQDQMYNIRKFFMLPSMFNTEHYVDYSYLNIRNFYARDETFIRHIFIYTNFTHVRFVSCTFVGCIFHETCNTTNLEFIDCKFIQGVEDMRQEDY
jgi:hypothetical protein